MDSAGAVHPPQTVQIGRFPESQTFDVLLACAVRAGPTAAYRPFGTGVLPAGESAGISRRISS